LIKEQGLLDIDRIIPSVQSLRDKYNQRWATNLNPDEFTQVLNELEDVAVPMVSPRHAVGLRAMFAQGRTHPTVFTSPIVKRPHRKSFGARRQRRASKNAQKCPKMPEPT